VIVGDRSFWGDDDTAGNFAANGIAAAARRAGATLLVFDDAIDWVTIPRELTPSWRGDVRVPAVIADADHIINLACLKTHFITACTLTLKNALGLVHAADRARPGNLRTHDESRLYDQIADVNRFFAPSLNVIDGWRALVSGGPTPSSGAPPTIITPRIVIASRDRVAADVAGIDALRALAPRTERITTFASGWDHPMIKGTVFRN
jgi:uncharacterized protein (DUF362 family)